MAVMEWLGLGTAEDETVSGEQLDLEAQGQTKWQDLEGLAVGRSLTSRLKPYRRHKTQCCHGDEGDQNSEACSP